MGGASRLDPVNLAGARIPPLLLIGPPGAGKGTQSRAIGKAFNIAEISTGAMLRDAVRRGTDLGQRLRSTMDSGGLVPDEVVSDLIEQRTGDPDSQRGFIVDGFPRNVNQAVFLDRLLASRRQPPALALLITVDRDVLLKRLAGRRECPVCRTAYNVYLNPPQREDLCDHEGSGLVQRPDDRPDAVVRRLDEYERQTMPVIAHYRGAGQLEEVDGNGAATDVTAAILRILKDR